VCFSVTGKRQKNVAFLVTAAIVGGLLVVCLGQFTADGPESGPGKAAFRSVPAGGGSSPAHPKGGARMGGSRFAAGSLFASDPNVPASPAHPKGGARMGGARADEGFGGRELFFKTMFMVVLVAVLGAAAIYVSKKLLPRITNLPGKEIRVVETVHLGPRKTVHLLRIGHQWILIGSTNEEIRKLADVTDALADLSPQEQERDTVRV